MSLQVLNSSYLDLTRFQRVRKLVDESTNVGSFDPID